jgi:hypothetical protein
MRTVIGTIAASIVLYVWGFFVWGGVLYPYYTGIWKPATDDDAAAQSLREQFPADGVYYVPSHHADEEVINAGFEQGPVAIVHILDADGRSRMDSSIMIKGFVLNVVGVALIALMLHMTRAALPSYLDRVKVTAVVGLTAALLIEIGDHIWWGIDLRWKLYHAFYTCTAWIVTGLVLAAFIKPTGPSNADSAQAAAVAA